MVRQLSTNFAMPPCLSIAEHDRPTVSTVLMANSDSPRPKALNPERSCAFEAPRRSESFAVGGSSVLQRL